MASIRLAQRFSQRFFYQIRSCTILHHQPTSISSIHHLPNHCIHSGYHTLQPPTSPTPFSSFSQPISSRRTMFIQTQTTPNADALMFRPGREVMPGGEGGYDFPSIRDAGTSPLARKLFTIDGVRSIYFGGDFITMTKNEDVDWKVLRPEIFEVIMEYFTSGDVGEDGEVKVFSDGEGGGWESDTRILEGDSEVVAMIKELLETRVKPAVAEDGGSILFRGFDEDSGVVSLELQGACSTCSSSSITLKNGVENMLRHYIPEVKGVTEVENAMRSELERKNEEAFTEMERKLEQAGVLRS